MMQRVTFLLVMFVTLFACSKEPMQGSDAQSIAKDPNAQESVAGAEQRRSPIVAWVNGSEITEEDVIRSIVTTLGEEAVDLMSDSTRETVIDSLVLSRAVAQAAEGTLDQDELHALEAEVNAYREQLLVKRYLRDNAEPVPVTEEMIVKYYEDHSERFGGGTRQLIEIVSIEKSDTVDRKASLNALNEFERQPNWRVFAESIKTQGIPVRYAKTVYEPELLDKRLRSVVDRLSLDEVSPTVLVRGVPHRVKVVQQEDREPRELREVRGEVRNLLVPQQVKQAIKQVSGEVLATADVRYAKDSGNK